MSKNELMTVPNELKVIPELPQEVSTQPVIDIPENMKATVVLPEAVTAVVGYDGSDSVIR